MSSNIDPRKMMIINEFKNMSAGKSTEELLPLVLAMSQKSSSMGINFTEEETKEIISSMTKDLPPAEKQRVNMMMNMMNMMKKS